MSSRTELRQEKPHNWWLAVSVLTAIALAVRLPGINGGMWVDEIVSIVDSFRTPFPESLAEFGGDNKHPLYSILAHASAAAFGESAWSVRLPAMVFGFASVPLLYALGARFTAPSEAFAASALLALSYHHVWFSQNARGYTMLAFWAVLGTILLLRAVRDGKPADWLSYGVVSGLGVYTHLTFVFVVAGQAIVILFGVFGVPRREVRITWRGPALGYFAALLATLVLYAPMLERVFHFFLNRQSNLRGVSTPTWALIEGFRVLLLGFGGAGVIGALLVLGGAALGLAGMASYWRQQPRVFLFMVVPAIVTLLGAIAAGRTIYPRFFLGFMGFALLFWMRGAFVTMAALARRAGWSGDAGRRLGAAIAGAVIVVSALTLPRVWRLPKQDFGGALRFVEASVANGDVIATADVTTLIYGPFYRRPWQALRSGSELDELRSKGTVWLVYTFPRFLSNYNREIGATAERECGSARRFRGTVGDGDVIVCKLPRTLR